MTLRNNEVRYEGIPLKTAKAWLLGILVLVRPRLVGREVCAVGKAKVDRVE